MTETPETASRKQTRQRNLLLLACFCLIAYVALAVCGNRLFHAASSIGSDVTIQAEETAAIAPDAGAVY